jgi:putative FmdB family regulatory protein
VPTYQYACTECGEHLEAVQSFSDPALTVCPTCQGRLRKVFNSVGIVFKGSGFYRNDSRAAPTSSSNGSKTADSTPADSGSSTSSSTSDSSSPSSSSSSNGSSKTESSSSSPSSSSSGTATKAGAASSS